MFRRVSLSIIRSLALYTQQQICHTDYADCLQASSQHNLYDIYLLLCVQFQTTDEGQRNCPKHVEFYYKNKFEKLLHLVGFIIRTVRRVVVTSNTWDSNHAAYILKTRSLCHLLYDIEGSPINSSPDKVVLKCVLLRIFIN